MTVSKNKDRASFFIPSTAVLDELSAAKLQWEQKADGKPRDKSWCRIYELRIEDVNRNEDLFKRIVRGSVEVLKERQSKKAQ